MYVKLPLERSKVHARLKFSYADACPTRTAWDGHSEQLGVCRDFAHLAITLCRCMNIPARYCTGYLGDIGVPPVEDPMDFSACLRCTLAENGTLLTLGITLRGLAAFLWLPGALRPRWRF